ncbi:MAG: hypothetical protein COT81_03190 [Candidatus Buchananbacteria bacterium CG10_big_fil_rev_8_21_14_0_10_42_9]|uniref:O-antigen ligase-related domain-containing protein n=1 Tax=Candidatus Buchananbacteria bacterium CG10_big_fil_rev_8_21_14_0_10_42_9 TaxID=1974526 RepID=A0A2H0W0Y1_9BACT|nr:MAG: hypothetical protein COT81_03190 [Candidatus Buchananbacteria bacterium CG10_big_fil_rev_8_21_14_0_10_42_9]
MSQILYAKYFDFKPFKLALFYIAILELLSWLTWGNKWLHQFIFILILLVTFEVYKKSKINGLLIILAELFIGSFGRLYVYEFGSINIPIRYALFLIIILPFYWLNRKPIMSLRWVKIIQRNFFYLNYAVFLALVSLGIILGLLFNTSTVLQDANAWGYFALLPIFLVTVKVKHLPKIIAVLTASVTWLTFKTTVTTFLFSYNLAYLGSPFYRWIRDTRVGEITYISGTLYRVFIQSQIFSLITFFIFLALFLWLYQKSELEKFIRWLIFAIIATSFTVFLSQSRSFWVSGLATLAIFIVYYLFQEKLNLKKLFFVISFLIVLIFFNGSMIYVFTGTPPIQVIKARVENIGQEPGGSSRRNQLLPLINEIKKRPFFGHGFGKQITYESNDPRVRALTTNGQYTTYAFELAYLDVALKIGLLGLLAYLILLGYIGFKLFLISLADNTYRPIYIGLLFGLVALVSAHAFTPFLNHPLGIGYVLILSAIVSNSSLKWNPLTH